MSGLHIARREAIEHDGSLRVLAAGRTRGGSVLLQVRARFVDLQATWTREAAERTRREQAAGIEIVRRTGREAWRIHHEQEEAS